MFPLLVFLIGSVYSQNWKISTSGTTNNLNAVCFVSADTGYVAGDKITVLKTVDGGLNWIPRNVNLPNTISFKSIFFRNALTGWVVGQTGIILRTTDGGNTWLTPGSLMPYIEVLNAVDFPTHDTGYVVGGSHTNPAGYFDKSATAGYLWMPGVVIGAHCLNAVHFTDVYKGCTVGDSGTILKTSDGAITWNNIPSATTKDLNSVFFTDMNNGFIVGDSGLILRTANGGDNWTFAYSGTSENLLSVYFYDPDTGYACGDNGIILNTSDGGNSWTSMWSGTSKRLHSICFPGAETGYAVGDSGTILKTTNGGGVGITHNTQGSKKVRIFPNPATDCFTIEIAEVFENATIVIANVTGEIVYKQTIRANRIKVDCHDLPPSVYILHCTDNKTQCHLKVVRK
ncbi:MAG: YCF48-related protein [Bacteroidota bacterium]